MGVVLSVGCTTVRPTYEFVLARSAFEAARDVEAARYAPGFYHKAEEAYRRGTSKYDERDYEGAVAEFKVSREFAEKAETSARVQRHKSGDEGL